jgi:hypothetical protein
MRVAVSFHRGDDLVSSDHHLDRTGESKASSTGAAARA